MRRDQVLHTAIATLRQAGVPTPERDARALLQWVLGVTAAHLTADSGAPVTQEAQVRMTAAVTRRAARTPVSHITGERLFWGHLFEVTPDVLDPRPESETLIAAALGHGPFRRVLDLGTGSGCLLLSLLAEWPGATGLGIDLSTAALAVARRNAERLGVVERVTFEHGDWLQGLNGTFDLIVANPPYIAEAEMADLSPEVRDHEPHLALSPGGDGLDAYRELTGVGQVLTPAGLALFEIGPAQAADVTRIMRAAGLHPQPALCDMDGRDRVIPVRR